MNSVPKPSLCRKASEQRKVRQHSWSTWRPGSFVYVVYGFALCMLMVLMFNICSTENHWHRVKSIKGIMRDAELLHRIHTARKLNAGDTDILHRALRGGALGALRPPSMVETLHRIGIFADTKSQGTADHASGNAWIDVSYGGSANAVEDKTGAQGALNGGPQPLGVQDITEERLIIPQRDQRPLEVAAKIFDQNTAESGNLADVGSVAHAQLDTAMVTVVEQQLARENIHVKLPQEIGVLGSRFEDDEFWL